MAFKIAIRINRFSKGGPAAAVEAGMLAGAGYIERAFRAEVREEAKALSSSLVYRAIMLNREGIIRDVERDLSKFGRQVANYFTRIESPNTSSRRKRGPSPAETIQINLTGLGPAATDGAGFTVNRRFRRERPVTAIRWAALSPRTIRNKRHTTYFINSGELKQALVEGLGPAFVGLVNPAISIEKTESGDKVARIRALMNPRFRTGLLADRGAVGDRYGSEKLILSYLKTANQEVTLAKLANLGRIMEGTDTHFNRPHRPFIQPALAFWVLSRLPVVFGGAVNKALKRKRSRRADAGRQFEGVG
jgi:hypothetical protein